MRVLLLGEFSGLYKYLVDGLRENGVEVDWFANGDHWKKISGMTGTLDGSTGNKFVDRIVYPYQLVKQWKDYDIVQLICPIIFSPRINIPLIKMLKKNNKKLVLTAAGTDVQMYRAYKNGQFKYPYYAFDGYTELDELYAEGKKFAKNDDKVLELVDYVIPTSYEYAEGYRKHPKALKAIPIAINTDEIPYQTNIIKNQIVIFHGLNREIIKGTPYIREAMNIIQKKYPDEVKTVIDGRMPFDKYMQIVKEANIIVDECKGYTQGMNALISMAKGKVILGGAEPDSLLEFDTPDCPVFNIRPDVNQIVETLEQVIVQKENITALGLQSREYVKKYHNHRLVAQKYIETWKKIL